MDPNVPDHDTEPASEGERRAAADGASRPLTVHLGPLTRIPLGEGRVLTAAGIAVAVFRSRSGALFATEPHCPHRGGPLADGLVGGCLLVCPLHGFEFDLATGQPVGNGCRPLRTYPVAASARGEVVVRLDRRWQEEARTDHGCQELCTGDGLGPP
jgi:nitrite reductase (NADH) small subunit